MSRPSTSRKYRSIAGHQQTQAAKARGSLAGRFVEPLENRTLLAADFTIISIPDSQYDVEVLNAPVLNTQTQWIANNAAASNIRFVAQQGDLLRRGYSDYQAGQADTAFARLNGIVPYTLDIGNHDYDNQFDDLDHHISSANFTKYFGDSRYQNIANSGFGGSTLDQRNRFHIFSAEGDGSQQYMVMSLEWEPSNAAISWAQGVINANPQLPVILTTHEYLKSAGRTTTPMDAGYNDGEDIFQKLVYPNPQIILTLSGHTGANYHQISTNSAGSTVIEATADEGNGYFQLFKFSPTNNKIYVTTYSPTLNQNNTIAACQYELPFSFSTRLSFTGTPVTVVPPTNTTPIAIPDAAGTIEGKAVTISVIGNDTDQEALSPILATLPAHGAVFANPDGTFTYTPDPKYTGSDSFTYVASDGYLVSAAATVTVTITPAPAATVYNYPIGETTTYGTKTGSYLNLTASDGSIETVKQISRSGVGDLDQKWQFNVTGGTEVAVCINAWRATNSGGLPTGAAEYHLSYSTNGSTFTDMTQIVAASSRDVTRIQSDAGEPYQMWLLPAATKGAVWIRATDTGSNASLGALVVDELFIRSTGVTPVAIPNAPSGLRATYTSKTRKATLKWTDNATTETSFTVAYSTNGGSTWTEYSPLAANTTSFTTTALIKGLTYLFKVKASNSAGDSAFSDAVTVLT